MSPILFYKFYPQHFSSLDEFSEMWPQMYVGFHVKYPLCSSDFSKNWIFSAYIRKILKYSF